MLEHDFGGHFSGLDNPPALIADIREMGDYFNAWVDSKTGAVRVPKSITSSFDKLHVDLLNTSTFHVIQLRSYRCFHSLVPPGLFGAIVRPLTIDTVTKWRLGTPHLRFPFKAR
jgi:hypothetical protein